MIITSELHPQNKKNTNKGVRLYETMVVNYPYMVTMNPLPTYDICAIYFDLKSNYTPQNEQFTPETPKGKFYLPTIHFQRLNCGFFRENSYLVAHGMLMVVSN